jgi:protoporphyrinogen oxidase
MSDILDYIVVGAGPSGLTFAYQALKSNKKVMILERDSRVGGLAKSYNYNGNIFDTGPKRFHTDDPIVQDFLKEIMSMDVIGRSTKVFFLNKYFDWPINLKSVLKLPVATAFKSMIDLIKKEKFQDLSKFENYIKSKYGNNLYNIFFKPYTEKFLNWPAEDIHSDWASTGINRTVIDKNVKANSIVEILKSLALPEKIDTKFLYPSQDGFGAFFDKLFSLIENNQNSKSKFNVKINKILKFDNYLEVFFDEQSVRAKKIIWTGNLNFLANIIESSFDSSLKYINTMFYNIVAKEDGVQNNKSQWIYVSDKKNIISRITCMKEFSKSTCNDGTYNFIVEVTDSQNNPTKFNREKEIENNVLKELEEMNFIKGKKYVDNVFLNKIVDTYPIYHSGYKKSYNDVVKLVRNFSRDIHLLGRTGAYWYNNSDHSIRMSIEMSKFLDKKSKNEFNFREYF